MNSAAAMVVAFDKTVAVPRGPKNRLRSHPTEGTSKVCRTFPLCSKNDEDQDQTNDSHAPL